MVLNNIGIEYLSVNGKPLSERIEISRLSSTREVVREHNSRPLQYASLFGGIDYLEEGTAASDKSKFSSKRASDGVSFSDLENTRREVDEIYAILSKNSKKHSNTRVPKQAKPNSCHKTESHRSDCCT